MERVLVLVGLSGLVAVLVASGRLLAHRRLRWLRQRAPTELWHALGATPDGRPTVVVFSTPGCAACRTAQRPALVALEERTGGRVRVIHVDAVERPAVARAFGVLTSPSTVVLDPDGAVAAANHGLATADRLAAQLGIG